MVTSCKRRRWPSSTVTLATRELDASVDLCLLLEERLPESPESKAACFYFTSNIFCCFSWIFLCRHVSLLNSSHLVNLRPRTSGRGCQFSVIFKSSHQGDSVCSTKTITYMTPSGTLLCGLKTGSLCRVSIPAMQSRVMWSPTSSPPPRVKPTSSLPPSCINPSSVHNSIRRTV